jgi:hypothetical protein
MNVPKMPERGYALDTIREVPSWQYVEWLEARVKEARELMQAPTTDMEALAFWRSFNTRVSNWLAATKDVP